MKMSPEAIANDVSLGLPLIAVKKIYADPNFNCRGTFGAAEVIELARDTAKRGLVEPVIIRKLWDNEQYLHNQGYEYSLVAGFRRHFSYRVNEADVIPCVIRDIKSDFECRDINAVENLQRLDLNLLQEAKSIQHYINAGWSRDQIASRVSKSPGWVQIREMVLNVPEEVQTAIAQNYILQDDLKEIYKLRNNKHEMLKLAGIIRDKRKSGQKKDILKRVKRPTKPYEVRVRKSSEIQEMMDIVREVCKKGNKNKAIELNILFSPQGNSITTRLMAWSCGTASNLEAHQAIAKLAEILETNYQIPEFVL